ncbi:MAG: histidine--tRNA ligase [Pseudomonadota bacterium]
MNTAPQKKSSPKNNRLLARIPRGFTDQSAADLAAVDHMMSTIRRVYASYGFEHVETPLIEYTDALGKYLPDQDRPNEGVFSFQDDDEQWLSLRYDLTAPLARYVAENFDRLPKPYRSYRFGPVFRNEKPGPGRFRQFLQFDADTVGSASPASDAEMCMMMADTMEALGLKRGEYVVKVNSRRVLDSIMESIGLGGDENAGRRLGVMRAIDKLDRLGEKGVHALLGMGRKDESGDFTKGSGLADHDIQRVIDLLKAASGNNQNTLAKIASLISDEAVSELGEIAALCTAAGYDEARIEIDPSIVRGLEYYTGAVFEAQLTFPVQNEKGETVVFGSVGGGGRYDGLVSRFRGEPVPATGFSIGVSRLLSASKARGLTDSSNTRGPVVVSTALGMTTADAFRLAKILREGGIATEIYLGTSGKLGNQLTYASKRGSPCVIIQGDDERAKGEVIVRDMVSGEQIAVKEMTLTENVKKIFKPAN